MHFLSFTVFLKPNKRKTYQNNNKKNNLLMTPSICMLNASRRWHTASSSHRPRLVLLIFPWPPSWAPYRSHPCSSSCMMEHLKTRWSHKHETLPPPATPLNSASEGFSKRVQKARSITQPHQRLPGTHVKAARLCEPWLKPKKGFSYVLRLFL